jgi:hypothetical protein
MEDRINEAWDRAINARQRMRWQADLVDEAQEEIKLANLTDYLTAKNSEQRQLLLLSWLKDNEQFQIARQNYRQARDDYRIAMLEIQRLRMLIESAAVAARYGV